jgi:hypothetical protein
MVGIARWHFVARKLLTVLGFVGLIAIVVGNELVLEVVEDILPDVSGVEVLGRRVAPHRELLVEVFEGDNPAILLDYSVIELQA